MKDKKKSKAMEKLSEICKDTNNPNFAVDYQLGVMNLLTESLIDDTFKSATIKAMQEEGEKKIRDNHAKTFDEGLKDIMGEEDFEKATSEKIDWKGKLLDLVKKEQEHSQMMFECAKVNEAEWNGVDEVKKMRERTRKLTYHNMEKRLIQLEKHIINLLGRI
mgnify:CR=1 FL=1|tara:strand:+ start:1816 stop:2301 length:486 start_codon:yes stop_codon:yes gene_type:complete